MAIRYIGTAVTDGPQLVGSDVIGAAAGGTLAGAQLVQVVFDDAQYGSTAEGKQRLLNALEVICARIRSAKVWPLESTS